MNTTLFLIRHAEVEAAYQGVFGGTIDMNLSQRGEQQAAALANYLRPQKFDLIFSSPMKRVQQTLAPALKQPRPTPIILPKLHEVHFGDWQGLNFPEVKARFGYEAYQWLELLAAGTIPNGENLDGYRSRVDSCLQTILQQSKGKTVGVFCHGGVIRMLMALLLNLPFAEMDRMEIEYTSITTVVIKPERTRLQVMNFTPWRDLPS
ncbi:MAG: histidine phosphatase family protein [Verrucomicrobiota bacterium]